MHRRWNAAALCGLLWLLLCAAAAATPVELQVLSADQADPPIEHVVAGQHDDGFVRFGGDGNGVLQPSADGVHWLRLIVPPVEDREARVLAIGRFPMRLLDVYMPGDTGWDRERRSFYAPNVEDFYPHAYVFDLPPQLDGGGEVYLRVAHDGRLYVFAQVQPANAFYRSERNFIIAVTAGFTAMAVMLLVNLVYVFALRERMFLVFAGFLGAQMGWTLFATGTAFVLPGGSTLGLYAGSMSAVLVTASNALLLHFARIYVDFRAHPWSDHALRALSIAFAVLAVLYLMPTSWVPRVLSNATSTTFLLTPPLLLLSLVAAPRERRGHALIFLFAWMPLGALSMARTLVGFGWMEPEPLSLYAPLFAAAWCAVMLSIGMASRTVELRIQRDRAQRQADVDALTGAMSRHAGEHELAHRFERARREARMLSLIFIDLDLLKEINDSHSHDAGDACLRALARRVKLVLARHGELARWGGDEFLAILPDVDQAGALKIAEAMRDAIRQPFEWNGVPLALACSLGVATRHKDDGSANAIVRRADAALYIAKREGRDRVAIGGVP